MNDEYAAAQRGPKMPAARSPIAWRPLLSGLVFGLVSDAAGSVHPRGIYPQEAFVRLIRYECLRSDRLNASLSLLVLRLPRTSPPPTSLLSNASKASKESVPEEPERIASRLVARIRATDAIGRLDSQRLGVLLVATDEAGARSVAKSLAHELPPECVLEECSTYPGGPGAVALMDRGDVGASDRVEISEERLEAGGYAIDAGVTGVRSTNGGAGAEEASTRGANGRGVAAGVESVLARPTPRWKRRLDIVGATVGLFLCAPLFALVALYIRLVSPGPVFFTQPRVGRGGKEFRFFKFRTMHCNSDQGFHSAHAAAFIRAGGSMAKLDDRDPRIIPGGRFLRVTCIDELPQLYNVLRGDMSLVGPRPCIPYEAAEYQRWHRHRFSILPGLTGLWQVSGKNKLSFAEMIRLDIRYEKTMSLWLDLLLILRTFPTIVQLVCEAIGRRLPRLQTYGRRAMSMAPVVGVVWLLAGGPALLWAQSLDVPAGSNATAVGVYSEFEPGELPPLVGGYSSLSIGGVMDLGAYFVNQIETIGGTDGSNQSLGFMYDVLPFKQDSGAPVSLQVRLRYGITFVDRELVRAELARDLGDEEALPEPFRPAELLGRRTHYSLAAGMTRYVRFGDVVRVGFGAQGEYRVARSIYTAVFVAGPDDDDNRLVGALDSRMLFGPSVELGVRFAGGTVVTADGTLWLDRDANLSLRPALRFTVPHR